MTPTVDIPGGRPGTGAAYVWDNKPLIDDFYRRQMMNQQRAMQAARLQGMQQAQRDRQRAIMDRMALKTDDFGYFGQFMDDYDSQFVPAYIKEQDNQKAFGMITSRVPVANSTLGANRVFTQQLKGILSDPDRNPVEVEKLVPEVLVSEYDRAAKTARNGVPSPNGMLPINMINERVETYNPGAIGARLLSKNSGQITKRVERPNGTGFEIVSESIADEKNNIIPEKAKIMLMSDGKAGMVFEKLVQKNVDAGQDRAKAEIMVMEQFFPGRGFKYSVDNTPTKQAAGSKKEPKMVVGQTQMRVTPHYYKPGQKFWAADNKFDQVETSIPTLSMTEVAKVTALKVPAGIRYLNPNNTPIPNASGQIGLFPGEGKTDATIGELTNINAGLYFKANEDLTVNGRTYRRGNFVPVDDAKKAAKGQVEVLEGFYATPMKLQEAGPSTSVSETDDIMQTDQVKATTTTRTPGKKLSAPGVSGEQIFIRRGDLPTASVRLRAAAAKSGVDLDSWFAQEKARYENEIGGGARTMRYFQKATEPAAKPKKTADDLFK